MEEYILIAQGVLLQIRIQPAGILKAMKLQDNHCGHIGVLQAVRDWHRCFIIT